MSSKLEQALMRLDQVVEALEQTEPAPSSPTVDGAVKAEIHAIRGLVDEAMTLLNQHDDHSENGEAS